MSEQPDSSKPSDDMADADTANGEGPDTNDHDHSEQPDSDDPDAPGLSALGAQPGDAVEPNEPA